MATQDAFDPNAGLTAEQLAQERKIEEEEQKKNPELWKKNNAWLEQMIGLLKNIKPEEVEAMNAKFEKFIEGEVTWAELQGVPPKLLFEISEHGYLQFQRGRFKEAETIFKGLSTLDHKNAYYHSVLGAIYQKQDRLGDALAEYTVAVEMNPKDIASFVNRGEIYYRLGGVEEPLEDFNAAIALDPQAKNPWANRARFLKNAILQEEEADKNRK
ncbi:MAG: tetratricopeptide repeat protein [bacterium]